MITIGFTGTRHGMTDAQRVATRDLLRRLIAEQDFTHAMHGDCVGADEQFHKLALTAGLKVHLRPANLPGQRAWCMGAEKIYDPAPPLQRNVCIVTDCHVLVATPTGKEMVRSGTWSTVRVARRMSRARFIVWSDGREETE